MIRLFQPRVPPQAIDRAVRVLESGWISHGPVVTEFEDAFRERVRSRYAVAVNSCTSALRLALNASGVGPGAEVIVPSQTFIATAQAALAERAVVVFADVNADTGTIDTSDLARRITERTKAVIPVHFLGYPCDMDELHAVLEGTDATVIEDCAQALGATYRGRVVGSIGRYSCFSFQATKHITTGDGGMLTGTLETDEGRLRRRSWFGLERGTRREGAAHQDVTEVGFKYHMNDVCAALGCEQIANLDSDLARRRRIDQVYERALRNIAGLTLLRRSTDRQSACWMFSMRVQQRRDFVAAMKGRGVEAAVMHPRIDKHSVFGGATIGERPGQDIFDAEQVSIPLHTSMTDEDVRSVISSVQAGW